MRARCDGGTCEQQEEEQEQQCDASAGQLFQAQASPLMDNSLLRPLFTLFGFSYYAAHPDEFVHFSFFSTPGHSNTFLLQNVTFASVVFYYTIMGPSLQCITLFQQRILSLITLLGISAPVQLLPAVPPGEDVAHLPSLAILTLTTD